MTGITDIKILLSEMTPILDKTDYVFITKKCFKHTEEILDLHPIATFLEEEGMTVVVTKNEASKKGLCFDAVFHKITLEVHSSLEAVGLTAVISTALASKKISANVISGYYHDHIFIQKSKAELALFTLKELKN